ERLRRLRSRACLGPCVELSRLILRLDGTVVVNFPCRERVVSRAGERLRQCDVILRLLDLADAGLESVDARARRSQSGEQTGPRRIAQRGLAVRIGEKRSALCEPINVRRLRLRMPAQAADPVVLVVDGDEEDILPGPLRRR